MSNSFNVDSIEKTIKNFKNERYNFLKDLIEHEDNKNNKKFLDCVVDLDCEIISSLDSFLERIKKLENE